MLIIHIITGLNDGGAEGVLYRLCTFDVKHKHIVISMMGEGKYGTILRQVGIEVTCLNMSQSRISLSGLWSLFKLLKYYKPDVVQTWMYHADLIGGIIAKMAGAKTVFWNIRHTTLQPGKSKRSTIWIAKTCALISAWIPNTIVYCAHNAKTVHEALGYKKGKAVIIGNGYNLDLFSIDFNLRKSFRSELGIGEEDNLIGMVGRYNPQKDHTNLIESLSLVRKAGYKFKTVLIGADLNTSNQIIANQIFDNELNEHILLLGQRADVPVVMNGLDIHVLSSSFGEAFPNVLAEAMACGTPCVTTDVGDAGLIVGETGWLVAPKNPKSLADAIITALDEKHARSEQWNERKIECRNRIVDNFSIEKMVSSYHNVWFSV